MSGFFQFLSSPKVSLIVSLAGLMIYLFFNSLIGRSVESLDEKLLFPAVMIWAAFSAALVCHIGWFCLSGGRRVFNNFKARSEKKKRKRKLKANAELYFDNLEHEEIMILFDLYDSKEYTSRLDLSDRYVMNLESLGMVEVKKRISIFEGVCSLSDNVIEYVRKEYLPYYFDQLDTRFNPNDQYVKKLVDLFYCEDLEGHLEDVETLSPLIIFFVNNNMLYKNIDHENNMVFLKLNEFFSIYLEKIYDKAPVRSVLKIKIR